jgi:hypothetical protein
MFSSWSIGQEENRYYVQKRFDHMPDALSTLVLYTSKGVFILIDGSLVVMDHIVYVDNKAGELEQLLKASKTMILRGAAGWIG